MELDEYIERLAAIRDGLDEKIREARGFMKDLERVYKEMARAMNHLNKQIEAVDVQIEEIPNMVDKQIGEAISKGLVMYNKSIKHAIAQAEESVFKRFEDIAFGILDYRVDENALSIEQMIRASAHSKKQMNSDVRNRNSFGLD